MTVAILHYHLRRGGVTRVIESQSRSLSQAGVTHVVAAGTPYEGGEDLPACHVPDLDYRSAPGGLEARDLLARTESALAARLGAPPDLWHIHNHSLGKNRVVSEMASLLADRGTPVLLQVHDFSEDGRPANYEALDGFDRLYPITSHVHYAFINSRDRTLLLEAGLPRSQCHLLPNAITPPSMAPEVPSSAPTVLYPVRGIRRKNLGELCLMAALAPEGCTFGVSLNPENPEWQPIHDRWEHFAKEHRLPVRLGVVGHTPPAPGVAPSFENWLAHSTHLVTTSIAEGFGLAFLEPIGLGKPLFGRDLADITQDFKSRGIALGTLYQHIPVPLSLLDTPALRDLLAQQLTGIYRTYQRELPAGALAETWEALTPGDRIDFGNLPESFQESVLAKIAESPGDFPFSKWLSEALTTTEPASPPSSLGAYQLDSYRQALLTLYRDVAESPVSPPDYLPKSKVLDQFFKPERFHFLRT